ncbi:putative ATPase [Dyadobacter jejuensis]|uniref:Putative ATPase n=1 Tax=Dyadobacter jejuensis TaxID=1082580 RepID=A0A316AB21_9BACT|nr:AAA family ATPase [Dyadobacter jejuensis]PWJ54762.1 putative ATPase [Dyadobacter jejuensis]
MKKLISKSARSLVYHIRQDSGADAILKIFPDDAETEELVQRELELSHKFTTPHFRKALSRTIHNNQLALLLEHIEGISLKSYLQKNPCSLESFYSIALNILDLLDDLQRLRMLHNRFNPYNILIEPVSGRLTLIDFSMAECAPFSPQFHAASKLDAAELPYFPPEQIGRIGRKSDYRSDFFSAGVLFYEILTRQLPYKSNQIGELLREIVLSPVPSARWVNSQIPKCLDEVLSKLLSKSTVDRYQSVYGLRRDIEFCRDSAESPEKRMAFIPGQHDRAIGFKISEKIYGRESDMGVLSQQLQHCIDGQKALVQIQGAPGTGKTALANRVRIEVLQQGGVFIYGQFDITKKENPFYAIAFALKELATHILCEDQHRLEQWRSVLHSAVGEVGKVLTNFVPEFKWIIGEQPEVPALTGAEAQSRLEYVFQRLFETLAVQGQPLIVFLDDFQWADHSSSQLVDALIHYPRLKYFMLITASRPDPNAMVLSSPVYKTNITHLSLRNLTSTDIYALLEDSIPTSDNHTLAQLIFEKTNGNPFYTHQFLHALWQSEVFSYDSRQNHWHYNSSQLSLLKETENVLEFILNRLKTLSGPTMGVLQVASCFGRQFGLNDLSVVCGKSIVYCQELLEDALLKEFIRKAQADNYEFAHDHILESVYQGLQELQRKCIHASIGQHFLKTYGNSPHSETLFNTTRQLHLGLEELPADEHWNYLILNYKCGVESSSKAAFSPALEYYRRAIMVLRPEHWGVHYELIVNLYIGAAESAAIVGERAMAEAWAQEIINRSNTLATRMKGYEVKLDILNENHEMSSAIELLLVLLNDLGYPIKRNPSQLDLLIEYGKTKLLLKGRKAEALAHLPAMTHESALMFMKLTAKCTTSIFSAAPELLPSIVFKQVQLSLKFGNSPYSAVGYAAYGFALASIMGDLNQGYAFGKLALGLVQTKPSDQVQAKVMAMFYGFLSYWKSDIREAIPALKKSYIMGRETGDLLYASFSATFHSCLLFFTGERLHLVAQLMQEDSVIILEMKQDLVYVVSENQRQMVHHLVSPQATDLSITGNEPTEKVFVQKLLDKKDSATLFDFYVYKLFLHYLLSEATLAYSFAEKAREREDESSSRQMSYPHYLLIAALAASDAYILEPHRRYLQRIQNAKTKLKKIAHSAPGNFLGMYQMVAGAYCSATGDLEMAKKYFGDGIEFAREKNYLHLEAIGYEALGKIFARTKAWSHCELVIRKSYATYWAWGSMAKCLHLERQYPELFIKDIRPQLPQRVDTVEQAIMMLQGRISTISDVKLLLKSLMQMVVELCHVDRALLLFSGWDQSIQVKIEEKAMSQILNSDAEVNGGFPLSAIHLALRSGQPVWSADLSKDARFFSDPYISQNAVQSLIGFPLGQGGNVKAIIYLETLTDRLPIGQETLNTLNAMAGLFHISVENAQLLEEHERVRRLETDYNNQLLTISHSAEENERRRIAADLHDDIGALLSTIKLYLSHGNSTAEINLKAKIILDQAIQNLRQLSHRLSPASLEKFGLVVALQSMIHDIQQASHLQIELRTNLVGRLPESIEVQLYRILQELFNNTLKYAQASSIFLRLEQKHNLLECEYTDNGVGFDMGAIQLKHEAGKAIGLQNIANRSRTLGGKLYIYSTVGHGIRMNLEIKL